MATLSRRLINWAAAFEDGALIRATFFGLLSATAVILYLDYTDMSAQTASASFDPGLTPILPAFDPSAPGGTPGPAVTISEEALRQPLTVTLVSGGVLELTGTIVQGSAEQMRAELADRAEYVKIVALNSPGGAVAEALEIGKLLRESGLTTSVAAGALCASSCPLIFAGGKERLATAQSAIGVHQIYAATPNGVTATVRLAAAGNAMSDAQTLTAEITRYLISMGVDPEVWLKALETPPDRLSYFSAEELTGLKLATRLTK